MSADTPERVTVDVGQTRGHLQLSINVVGADGGGTGYRLAGPKFDGTGETRLSRTLTERDAAEIRWALDRVYPDARVAAERERADAAEAKIAAVERERAVWFAENSAAQAALGRVRTLIEGHSNGWRVDVADLRAALGGEATP